MFLLSKVLALGFKGKHKQNFSVKSFSFYFGMKIIWIFCSCKDKLIAFEYAENSAFFNFKIYVNFIGLLLQKKTSNSVYRALSAQILYEKSAFFLRPQLSLKSKTITNQQRICCLVYPEITQISERSL